MMLLCSVMNNLVSFVRNMDWGLKGVILVVCVFLCIFFFTKAIKNLYNAKKDNQRNFAWILLVLFFAVIVGFLLYCQ